MNSTPENARPENSQQDVPGAPRVAANLEEKRLMLDWARLRAERQKSAAELSLKRKELARSSGKTYLELLANPFTLAIVGGFLTLMTSIVTNHFSTISNLETEQKKAEYAADVEKTRAQFNAQAANQTLEADLIKKFVEGSDKDIVRENLKFLVDAGLLPDYAVNITKYLKANPDVAPQVATSGLPEKGIEYVGRGFTPAEFKDYVAQLQFSAWKPEMIVLHNTESPSLALWHEWPQEKRETYFANLSTYFAQLGWKSGPHLFVDDSKIWVFNPLNKPGTHSPSWNRISIGIDMVGNYNSEPFDDKVRDNTVQAIAILDAALQLNVDTLHFHNEDPTSSNRTCPGRNVNKSDLARRIEAALRSARGG